MSKQRRICRSGCGVERKPNSCQTPGFPNLNNPKIASDFCGFKKLLFPRKRYKNGLNIIPTSSWLVLGWRGNCDVQFIQFESDPEMPDPLEIANITEYAVSYATKAFETYTNKQQTTRKLINNAKMNSGCKRDLKTLAWRVLNKSLTSKLISKQEAMVQLSGLKLAECSETIEMLSLSNNAKIDSTNRNWKGNLILKQYANRQSCRNKNLYDFFCDKKEKVSFLPMGNIQDSSNIPLCV